MSVSPRRVSLYLTLGIAAVDMLTCAFVASIILFIMFLMPGKKEGGGGTGSENQLVFQWEFTSGKAVVGFNFRRDGAVVLSIYSNDPELWPAPDGCSALSNSNDLAACRLIISDDGIGGMLIIQDPIAGRWDVAARYADATDGTNGSVLDDLDLSMSVIGVDAVQVLFSQLSKDYREWSLYERAQAEGISKSDLETALTIK